MKKIEAVLFDMDGVVVDSMPSHFETWQSVLNEYGLSVSMEDIYRREGMTGISSVKDIFLEKKVPFPREDIVRTIMSRKHALFEKLDIQLFPEITTILHCLKNGGRKIAIVTGSLNRSVMHVLPGDVFNLFDAIITAEDVDRGKPEPDPYRAALEALDVTASRSLVIENAPMGVQSARSAGIRCIAIETTLDRHWLSSADLVLSDHGALVDCLCQGLEN